MNRGDAVGRYRIETPLGGGGMGVVYLAEDLTLGQSAAEMLSDLKRLRRNRGSDRSVAVTAVHSAVGSGPSALGQTPATPASQSASSSSSDVQIVTGLVKRHRGLAVTAAALLATAIVAGVTSMVRSMGDEIPPSAPTSPVGPSIADLEITQLTTSGNALRPAISPDGKYVAYVQQDGRETSPWVRQTATGSNIEIVAHQPPTVLFGATVSPDGSFVDFVRGTGGQGPVRDLLRVPFLGGVPKRLIAHVDSPIGWSPDGQHFAFVRSHASIDGSTQVVIASADGSSERVLSTRQRPATF